MVRFKSLKVDEYFKVTFGDLSENLKTYQCLKSQ